jgi:hypothetical protein
VLEGYALHFRPSAQQKASENVYEKYFENANLALIMFVKIF